MPNGNQKLISFKSMLYFSTFLNGICMAVPALRHNPIKRPISITSRGVVQLPNFPILSADLFHDFKKGTYLTEKNVISLISGIILRSKRPRYLANVISIRFRNWIHWFIHYSELILSLITLLVTSWYKGLRQSRVNCQCCHHFCVR